MRWVHPESGRRLKLAYCLNLHPADDLAGCLDGMRTVTLPLRERLGRPARFGVGLYLPAELAAQLASEAGRSELARLAGFLEEHDLDPFTFNAFPFAGFGKAGLKQDVFRPTWAEAERLDFTRNVARVAAHLAGDAGHVSVSTHPGFFGAPAAGPAERALDQMLGCVAELVRIEAETGRRIVLSIEAEPRASAGDTRQLVGLLERLRARALFVLPTAGVTDVTGALQRHLGSCLDACHAAVEFESASGCLERSTHGGAPLGKIQFTNALALREPARNAEGREALLALDEPAYLHQVTGRRGDEFERAHDLGEVRDDCADGSRWAASEEWRCHFHVPVDLAGLGGGLGTTREWGDELLRKALARSDRWGTDELHVEIETYTWDILPGAARGTGELVDGLEREYRHVLALLESEGWRAAE